MGGGSFEVAASSRASRDRPGTWRGRSEEVGEGGFVGISGSPCSSLSILTGSAQGVLAYSASVMGPAYSEGSQWASGRRKSWPLSLVVVQPRCRRKVAFCRLVLFVVALVREGNEDDIAGCTQTKLNSLELPTKPVSVIVSMTVTEGKLVGSCCQRAMAAEVFSTLGRSNPQIFPASSAIRPIAPWKPRGCTAYCSGIRLP